MKIKWFIVTALIVALMLPFYGNISFAGGDESRQTAEKLLNIQLDAIVKGEYQKFIRPGNDAFKKIFDKWSFDSIKSQRGYKLKKGYQLKYLGMIKRLGAKEHLWKVQITDDTYEYLARVTITYGMVAGFDLD